MLTNKHNKAYSVMTGSNSTPANVVKQIDEVSSSSSDIIRPLFVDFLFFISAWHVFSLPHLFPHYYRFNH